jgi:hypothetical protein
VAVSEVNTLLKQIPVVRDECGYFMHPDLAHFWTVEMNEAEHCTKEQWAALEARAGIKTDVVYLETEPMDHPAYVSYYDNDDPDISAWDPSPPPGWWLLEICDGEDGPFAVWATHA